MKDLSKLKGITPEFISYVKNELITNYLLKGTKKVVLSKVKYSKKEEETSNILDEMLSFELLDGRKFKARETCRTLRYFIEVV
ncbi:hypothetical protein [Phosphitispora fastidiosa]|uniref:hypothetical protein n=1 Tax=Phosphitispora fastidiosa TaxID=2837202 RepID=UPI001E3EB712|nr:hypothetical protein [Phosphitispora fastidiosa]MBU7006592.1 hypothetical protein [Phosphitispora fastidiosa]